MEMRASAGARQHPGAPHLLRVWGGEGASPSERLGDLSPRSQNMKTGHRVSPRSAWFTFAPQALGESQGPAVIITKYLVLGILSTLLLLLPYILQLNSKHSLSITLALKNLTELCQIYPPLYIAFGNGASGGTHKAPCLGPYVAFSIAAWK